MEQKLLFLINREWTSPALDRFMVIMSSFALWAVPLLILAAVLLLFGNFKTRAMLVVLAATVGISDGVVSASLKKMVDRPRPHEALANVRRIDLAKARPRFLAAFMDLKSEMSRPKGGTGGRSFPSSHTMNNFCAATVLALFYRRWGWLYFPAAASVGYSRIYVGAHWPSDIAISIIMACGLGLLMVALAEWLWRRFALKKWPVLTAKHPSLLAPSTA